MDVGKMKKESSILSVFVMLAVAQFCPVFAEDAAESSSPAEPEAPQFRPGMPPAEGAELRYSYFGAAVETLPAASFCDEARPGVKVVFVPKNSPAAKVGVSVGDILITLDGQKIFFPNQLSALVRSYEPGTEVEVELRRGEEILKKNVKIGERVIMQMRPDSRARDDVRIYINGREFSLADGTDFGGWISLTPNGILIRDRLDVPAEFQQLVSRMKAKIPDSHRTLNFLRQQYDDARKAALGKAQHTFSQIFYGQGNSVVIVGDNTRREITVSRAEDGKVLFRGNATTQEEIDAIPPEAKAIIDSFTQLKPMQIEAPEQAPAETDTAPVAQPEK